MTQARDPWFGSLRRWLARRLDPGADAALRTWQQLAEQTLVEQAQIARVEKAVSTMAWWLVQSQTGFGERDARGIQDILDGVHASGASHSQSVPRP